MNNILIVVDKKNSAIDRLAEMIKKYSRENIEIIPIHPKRESEENINKFKILADRADLIHFAYYRTGVMLLDKFPELKDKPSILSHFNPYSILEKDWNEYKFNVITACNQSIFKDLKEAGYENTEYIRLAVDFDIYNYNPELDESSKIILMVAARIEGKKGVKEVVEACKELKYPFHLVGSISNQEYFMDLIRVGGVIYHKDITNEDLAKLYHKAAVHVCNSVDNFESGTLPILESMASGLPVLTRNIGHVPDIYNRENMRVRYGTVEDQEEIRVLLKELMENIDMRKEMRQKAYKSVIYYSADLMAREYSYLYRKVLYGDNPLVSIIVPTIEERKENVQKIIEAYDNQTYKNIEIIVKEDKENGYNLARVRNEAVIEAMGEILIFNDDRFIPEKDAVERFLENMKPKTWLFGNKDGAKKKSFVENFSCIRRQEFIEAGMFNQAIDKYGGMSQELRERFKRQGFELLLVERAKATSLQRAKSINNKLRDIKDMKIKLAKMGLQ